jgi:tetratricopeptide (TPR) repeat protein
MRALIFSFILGFAYSGMAQTDTNNRIVISDKGHSMEMKIGDSVFTISYDALYADYLEKGVAKAETGDYSGAISDFNTAWLYKNDDAQLYFNLGLAYYMTGDYSQALKDFTNCIELDSLYEAAYGQRGVSLCRLERTDESFKDFFTAIRLAPEKGLNYDNLGIAYLQAGLNDDACSNLNTAKELGYPNAYDVFVQYCE